MTYPQQQQNFGAPQFQQPPAQQQFAPQGTQGGSFFTQQDPHIQSQQGPAVPPAPQAGATQQSDTSGFWGGAAAISFDDRKGYVKGTPRGGQILSKTISNQTKMGTGEVLTWKDGSPRKQMVLLLQTAERADPQDNGQRQLFIKGDMPRAVREAFQAVGASDVEIGGWVYIAWVDEKAATQPGYNPQKVFKAIYAPPGSPDPMAGRHVPTPQPSASADQFAAHAAYQQTGTVPVQPNGAPAQFAPQQGGPIANAPAAAMANFQQQAQYDPNVQSAVYGQPQSTPQYSNQPGGQPGQTPLQQPQPATPSSASVAEWRPFS